MLKLFLLLVFMISVSSQESATDARYYFFHGYRFGRNTEYILEDAANIVHNTNFDRTKPTVLYLHGYLESITSLGIWTIVNAYIQRDDHNILVMDWSKYSDGHYFTNAIPGIYEIAPYASRSIISMFDAGLNITIFHLVGHSLGGQLAGLIGRTIYYYSNRQYKINRISGLDPAYPGFYPPVLVRPLNPFDANFVDVIHTDAGVFGAPVSTGSVDFWPNGGIPLQPGCSLPHGSGSGICSHNRSWIYWAESVQTQYYATFHAVKAKTWIDFIGGFIQRNDVGFMGLSAQPSLSGNYFLQTNSESPYSRGEQGLHYQTWPNDF